jgi:lysophospholipase L1-like esterase
MILNRFSAVAIFAMLIAISVALAFGYENIRLQLSIIRTEISKPPPPSVSYAGVQASLDRLSNEIRLSSPADLGHAHVSVRQFVIHSQLAQVKNPVVFVGDSITESAFLPAAICGHPVVNAGVGGATAGYYSEFAAQAMSELRAALVVISLGTNDAQIGANKAETFSESYKHLVEYLTPRAAAFVFVGIPPLEMTHDLARAYFDKVALEEDDAIIKAIAKTKSVQFADVRSAMIGEKLTVDGVHLNPNGYRGWMTAVSEAASKTLNCPSVSNQNVAPLACKDDLPGRCETAVLKVY